MRISKGIEEDHLWFRGADHLLRWVLVTPGRDAMVLQPHPWGGSRARCLPHATGVRLRCQSAGS